MRLHRLADGQRIRHKVKMGLMGMISGVPVPDVMRTLLYRSEFFGKPYSAWLHEAMRGPSAWSVGERELFGAFTSAKNACQFCLIGHSAASSQALGDPQLVEAVLDDWRYAPIEPRLQSVLGFIEKLILKPDELTGEDIDRLRAAGLSESALEEAIRICALFTIINRLADAFDFDTSLSSQPEKVAKGAAAMLRFGYRI